MRLSKIYIDNFRNLKNFSASLSSFEVLVGENNVGKTNILAAIGKVLAFERRRVYFDNEDFNDPEKPIVIELTFSDFSSTEEEAIFYDHGGIKNPDTNEVKIRLRAEWDERERDIISSLTFVREDLPQEEQEIMEFSWAFRRYLPYYYIPSHREIEREITSKRGDLFEILQSFTPYQIMPIATLRKRLLDNLNSLIHELQIHDYEEEIAEVSDLKAKVGEAKDIEQEEVETALSTLKEIESKAQADSEQETKELLIKTLSKSQELIATLRNRILLQRELQTLKENVKKLSELEDLEGKINELLSLFLGREHLYLDTISVKDEDLIQRMSVDIGDFSILKHGSGYQSLLVLVLKLFRSIYQVIKREEVEFRSFIVAIEEPEAHLHPHLQRHLVKVLRGIQNRFLQEGVQLQLIISTHSPYTLMPLSLENLTLLRFSRTESCCPLGLKVNKEKFVEEVASATVTDERTERKRKNQINRWLDQLCHRHAEIFFSKCIIVGEGETEQGAIPIFGERTVGDLDQYGISFLNGEGDSLIYPIKLMTQLKIPWVLIIDKDKEQVIKSLPEYKEEVIFVTEETAFEAEILSKVPLLKVLQAIDIKSISERNQKRIVQLGGEFSQLKDVRIESLTQVLEHLNDPEISKLKQEFVLKWLGNEKSIAFGATLAELLDKDEIPSVFVRAIRKATEVAIGFTL